VRVEIVSCLACAHRPDRYAPRIRDLETIDSELRSVAALRRAPRERGGSLPLINVADALLDERRELTGLPRLTRCLINY
jgi:hypothetical protein